MIRTTIYLPEELHQELKIKAATTKTSMSEIIINALEGRVDPAKFVIKTTKEAAEVSKKLAGGELMFSKKKQIGK
jgi:plasmid stability protein